MCDFLERREPLHGYMHIRNRNIEGKMCICKPQEVLPLEFRDLLEKRESLHGYVRIRNKNVEGNVHL
jgi:hypothetical protein